MKRKISVMASGSLILVSLLLMMQLVSCATPGGRTAGEVLDDSSIVTAVNSKLMSMPGVRSLGIDVDVMQGEVILSGRAHNENEEARIIDAVRTVTGVKKVTSMLKIIP
ncbi:MAG: BON domain-containing protein [Deltaproteobacteria bacterium]|nr:BON domain-containing protein [Deltaproteobacteria bacterium]